MNIFFSMAIGYLIGCFQTSFILGKVLKRIDIRDYGSGNAGASNAFRVLGTKLGIVTFLGDFSKAIIAYYITLYLFKSPDISMISGLFVVVGHNWPVFLKFKGGKGIASTLGLIAVYDYRICLVLILFAFIAGQTTKYISVASLTFSGLLPIAFIIMGKKPLHIGIAFVLCIFAFQRHIINIKRIKNGTEFKLGSKTNDKKKDELEK